MTTHEVHNRLFCRSAFFLCLALVLTAFSYNSSAATVVSAVPSETSLSPEKSVVVTVSVDLTGSSELLGSYSMEITWNPAELGYVSIQGGTSTGYTNVLKNESQVATGHLPINNFYAQGTGNKVTIARVTFMTLSKTETVAAVNLQINSLTGAKTFTDLTKTMTVNQASIAIVPAKPPIITTSALPAAKEDTEYYAVIETEPAAMGDTFYYEILEGPEWMSIDLMSGEITGKPTGEDAGQTYSVGVRVRNAEGKADFKDYEVTVENVNDPPVLLTDRLPNATMGNAYSFELAVEDEDRGDTHTFEIVEGPAWLIIEDERFLAGTPEQEDVGDSLVVTIKVSDKGGLFDESSFYIDVHSTNAPPEITTGSLPDVRADEEYRFSIEVTDPDTLETFIFELGGPGWLSIDNEGLLYGIPDNDDAGQDIPVIVTVYDSGGLFDVLETSITVTRSDLGSIAGSVRNFFSNSGIAGARIYIGDVDSCVTVSDGTFSVEGIPEGSYTLKVTAVQYQPSQVKNVAVVRDSTTTVDVLLKRVYSAANLEGNVADLNTGQPLENASITVMPGDFTASTNAQGYYSTVAIPAGTDPYSVTVSCAGYQPQTNASFYISGSEQHVYMDFSLAAATAPQVENFTPEMDDTPVVGEDEDVTITTTVTIQQGNAKPAAGLMKASATLYISEVRMFIDEITSGGGYLMTPVDGLFDEYREQVTLTFAINDVPDGIHNLYVRALNSKNEWGYPASAQLKKGYYVEPPLNVRTFDIADDQGHSIGLMWDPSVSENEGLVEWYRIFRSRSSTFNTPVAIDSLETIEALLETELFYPVLIDSIPGGEHSYTDRMVPLNNVSYFYWVQAVGNEGASKIAPLDPRTGIEETPVPFTLSQAYPNPFNAETKITFTIPEELPVKVDIYAITGQKIGTLMDRVVPPGTITVIWDGRDGNGSAAGTGVYILTVSAGRFIEHRRLVLLK